MPQPMPMQNPARPILEEMAARELAHFNGDRGRAIRAILAAINNDRTLLQRIVREAVEKATAVAVNRSIAATRRAIWHAPATAAQQPQPRRLPTPTTTTPQNTRAAVLAVSNVVAMSLYDMPLSDGTRLGDANRPKLVAQVHRYASATKDTGHKARLLSAVIRRLPDDIALVRSVVAIDELERLKTQTTVSAAEERKFTEGNV